MRERRRFLRLAGTIACVALGLSAAACSSSSGSSVASSGGAVSTNSPGNSTSALSAAEALATKSMNTKATDYPMPTTPVKVPRGVRVFFIDPTESNTVYGPKIYAQVKQAAKILGWTVSPEHDANNSPTAAAAFILQAIQQKYNAIVFPSAFISALEAPIKEALNAGLIFVSQDTVAPAGFGNHFITPDANWEAGGEALAAYTMVRTHGKAKLLTFPDSEFSNLVLVFKGFDAYIRENCPGCTISTTQFQVASLGEPGPPQWLSALSSNPPGSTSTTIAISPFSPASVAFAKTEASQGRKDIPVMDAGGLDTTDAQVMISQSAPYEASVMVPYYYETWVGMDQIARALANQPLYNISKLPNALITPANVNQVKNGLDPGFNYQAELENLWKTQ
jgi:ABC-type sugar transport system substrate-binding protein